jgi:hypothetical protein
LPVALFRGGTPAHLFDQLGIVLVEELFYGRDMTDCLRFPW